MAKLEYSNAGRLLFTEEMKSEYKILLPQMAPIHFELINEVLRSEGYNTEILKTTNQNLIEEGLKYVHNDTCVPALFVIGQLIDAIKNGGYDDNKIALLITQTGGGCRASNYIHLLRKALEKSGYSHVPVISFNISGLESNPGFSITKSMAFKALNSVLIGDALMQISNEVIPYEVNKGETIKLLDESIKKLTNCFYNNKKSKFKYLRKIVKDIIIDFSKIPVEKKAIPKVGIVGEIYVKFAPLGNNNLEKFLQEEGCEIIIPPMYDFVLFKLDYRGLEVDLYGGKKVKKVMVKFFTRILEKRRDKIRKMLGKNGFHVPGKFSDLKKLVNGYVGEGNRMGEGWLLTAEIIELIHIGAPNVICTQPFGCLPNHISGKGMFKRIKENHPIANIVAIDFDTSASEVNQVNRIKLMLTNAKKNIKK